MSATDACATPIVAPEAPSRARANNSSQSTLARPVRSDANAVPIIDATSTGLRPMRSDSLPSGRATMNCITEKAEPIAPMKSPLAPSDFA